MVLPSPSTTSPPNSTISSGFCASVAVHEQLQRGEGFSQSTRISTSVRFASRSLMEAKMASMSSPALAFAARRSSFAAFLSVFRSVLDAPEGPSDSFPARFASFLRLSRPEPIAGATARSGPDERARGNARAAAVLLVGGRSQVVGQNRVGVSM